MYKSITITDLKTQKKFFFHKVIGLRKRILTEMKNNKGECEFVCGSPIAPLRDSSAPSALENSPSTNMFRYSIIMSNKVIK